MGEKWHLGAMGRRLLTSLLLVSLTAVGVLAVGTVGPHLLARTGRHEEIGTGWLVAAVVVAVVTAVITSMVAAHRMVAPMHTIIDSTRTFAGGDHSIRLPNFDRPELAPLVDTLNAAADEVERSERSRRRLTADIAHELRTPLTALQAGLEELRDGLVRPDPERLDALHAQAVHLGRIVTDLTDLSDAESEGLHLIIGPVDLGSVTEAALAEMEHAMTSAGLVVRRALDPGVVVGGDAGRLHQVVDNLLANCTAYCRRGDTVDVRVSAHLGRGIIAVADSGPGFDDTEREHAFDRRWRGARSRSTAGSGLGLPIVQALVVAQGGSVQLSAANHSGTVVRIELPLHDDAPGAPESAVPPGVA
ncbi:MAG: ATP-binding protein [Dermatophilaceae bacterium]|nr:HAMP domain-containing histidine kinase [Intrasporangiaceae bacterium]